MKFTCTECGSGEMVSKVIPYHKTSVKGSVHLIPNAKVFQCTQCGAMNATTKELRRWEKYVNDELTNRGCIPNPKEVSSLREALHVSVSEFAAMLGVTRQTVHSWERESEGLKRFGPAAIVLQALRAELAQTATGVWTTIISLAKTRGIECSAHPTNKQEATDEQIAPPLRKRRDGGPSFASRNAA